MADFQFFVFCFFSAVILATALGVVLAQNTVHSALFLVVSFIASAGVWLLLQAEFLALVLVLVYVGAVMVLFLFVLMMFDIKVNAATARRWSAVGGGALLATALAAAIAAQLATVLGGEQFIGDDFAVADDAVWADNTRALGAVLYTDYVYPFELAAVILLVAIVAAIMLTLRTRKDAKYASPAQQVLAKKEDRLTVLKMPAEKKFNPASRAEDKQ